MSTQTGKNMYCDYPHLLPSAEIRRIIDHLSGKIVDARTLKKAVWWVYGYAMVNIRPDEHETADQFDAEKLRTELIHALETPIIWGAISRMLAHMLLMPE